MSINFKPINEVPEIEALNEGDKLLVNSNGTARQIDAEKVNPILKAQEAEELNEGDKILVNSGGNIVKVDASKVGGKSGGGGIVYVNFPENFGETTEAMSYAYSDSDKTLQMTYEEGISILTSGGMLCMSAEAMGMETVYMAPLAILPVAANKIIQAVTNMGEMIVFMLLFSDTNMGD